MIIITVNVLQVAVFDMYVLEVPIEMLEISKMPALSRCVIINL